VINHRPLVTYGANDMALDNWGIVERWIAEEKITTVGVSGIGFVNFGTVRDPRMEAPIETFGIGARGFNVMPEPLSGQISKGIAPSEQQGTVQSLIVDGGFSSA
jgi:hypothetical protein